MIENYKSKLDKMLKIVIAKNSDYAGDKDSFRNFELCEKTGICQTEKGFLVRMSDKMSRINTLLSQEGQVKDESIQDTLLDLSNYAILLACYLDYKKGKK